MGRLSPEPDRKGLMLSDSEEKKLGSGWRVGRWTGRRGKRLGGLSRNQTKLGGFCLILAMGGWG